MKLINRSYIDSYLINTAIQTILTYVTDFDTYYPSTVHTTLFINVPQIFDSVLQLAVPE